MDDREMNIAPDDKQPARCGTCGMGKMKVDGAWKCVNCVVEPKTGNTVILEEPQGEKGPVRIVNVIPASSAAAGTEMAKSQAPQYTPEQVEKEIQRRTNTVLLHVPTSLFPDLVMWARKLKLPRDWKEAEKIKAITDFQVEINTKLEGLSK